MTDERRYLWFAAYAGLWPSFRMEHRLADGLARAGRAVTMIHCERVLDDFCQVMASERLHVDSSRAAKRSTCRDCMANAEMTASVAAYQTVALDDYVTAEMRAAADGLMQGVTESTWLDFEIDDMPLGRWAAYTSMLRHRLPSVTDSPRFWAEYVSELRQSLLVAFSLPVLLAETNPSHAVVYNALYPNHRVFAELAQRSGAQLVALHAGSFVPRRYETVGIFQHVSASQTAVDSRTVEESLTVALSSQEVTAVGRQVVELAAGRDPWVYSPAPRRDSPEQLREQLGLRPRAPVVVALLSSPDETRASLLAEAEYIRDEIRGYSDVSEFISAVRGLAQDRPDIDVVLRLHPRMVPNKRDHATSPDLGPILEALTDLPSNARVNHPEDGISMYDLIGLASAAVNQSSSAGLEFLALGLPVVNYDPVRQGAYPPRFGSAVGRRDRAAMAEAVDAAIASGASIENSVRAFRWYATTCLRAVLLMSDVIGEALPTAAAGTQASSAAPRLAGARRIVPERFRARAARLISRRARGDAFRRSQETYDWHGEWLMRLDATTGTDVVWNPPIVVRGEPDPSREAAAVAEVVSNLRTMLGYDLDAAGRPVASL